MNKIQAVSGVQQSEIVKKAVSPVQEIKLETRVDERVQAQEEMQVEKEKPYISAGNNDMLKDAVEEANHRLRVSNSRCEYRFVEEANRVAIKVIDNETDKVLREIPSEESLKMIESIREMTGTLVDYQL